MLTIPLFFAYQFSRSLLILGAILFNQAGYFRPVTYCTCYMLHFSSSEPLLLVLNMVIRLIQFTSILENDYFNFAIISLDLVTENWASFKRCIWRNFWHFYNSGKSTLRLQLFTNLDNSFCTLNQTSIEFWRLFYFFSNQSRTSPHRASNMAQFRKQVGNPLHVHYMLHFSTSVTY